MPLVFFDTNVLIYRLDKDDLRKQATAETLVFKHFSEKTGIISSQVVQEVINVCLNGRKFSYSTNQVELIVGQLLEPMCQHQPTIDFYQRSLSLHSKYSLSFYDALIVQAAIDTDCEILYSEDLQEGQTFGKLTVQNPFKSRA